MSPRTAFYVWLNWGYPLLGFSRTRVDTWKLAVAHTRAKNYNVARQSNPTLNTP